MMARRTRFVDDTPSTPAAIRPYRPGQMCPGCGSRGWIINASSAECGNRRCGWLLPLAEEKADD